MATVSISGSVGKDAKNSPSDVTTIKNLLNIQTGAGLTVDGVCDQATIDAIIAFQKTFLSHPDGRIDPGGSTLHRLAAEKLVQLPQMSGLGYYPYSTDDRQYGTSDTIDTILDVTKTFRLNMPDLQIGVGDISFEKGGHMAPHSSHQHGQQVDIRPLRTDKLHLPCDFHDATYSREFTTLLAESFLVHRNVKRILFNDPLIKGVHPFVGHNNHLHVETRK